MTLIDAKKLYVAVGVVKRQVDMFSEGQVRRNERVKTMSVLRG